MPKRFTDTEKWKDEWFQSLDNDCRIVWQYLLDNCSISGIFKKNFKMLNFCCNTNFDEKRLLEVFDGRIVDYGKFYFIPKFLIFQYPKGLSSNKPAILAVRSELSNNDLLIIAESLFNDSGTIKDKDKDKDKNKDKDIKVNFGANGDLPELNSTYLKSLRMVYGTDVKIKAFLLARGHTEAEIDVAIGKKF